MERCRTQPKSLGDIRDSASDIGVQSATAEIALEPDHGSRTKGLSGPPGPQPSARMQVREITAVKRGFRSAIASGVAERER